MVAWLTTLVPEVLTLCGMVAIMLAIDPTLAVTALTVTPVLVYMIAVRRRRIQAAQRAARDEEGRLAAQATDVIRNVRAVQAFGQETEANRRFGRQNNAKIRASIVALDLEGRYSPLADIVLAVGGGLVLWVGVLRVTTGRLTLGLLLVILAYLSSLYGPIRSLSRLARTMAKAAASRERLGEIMAVGRVVDEDKDPQSAPPLRRGLAFLDVTFAYRPGIPVISRVSFEVTAGQRVCIVGPTGAGKSTLLGLMLRFYDPDDGSITIDGVDLRRMSLSSLRRSIALVPQDPWILDGTIVENIAFGRPEAPPEDVMEAARVALVDEFAVRLADGYNTRVGEGGVLLSGGQRRRIALARAVLRRSSLLLLDEPTSGLDAASEAAVMQALVQVSIGKTVVMVSHRLSLAATVDHIVVLGDGRVVEQGRPAELLGAEGSFARLWALQQAPAKAEAQSLSIEVRPLMEDRSLLERR
jgi:ATP-binding cassette subfamily B protein